MRLLLGLLAATLLILSSAPVADASKTCPRPLDVGDGRYGVAVERGVVSCATARKVLRTYLTAPRSRCGGSACYIKILGWDCIINKSSTGAPGCTRGQRRIAAYSADL